MRLAGFSARENPFRVERVLTVRYRPLDTDWDGLMARLRELNFRAAICGPEGVGKTTLLEDLGGRFNLGGQRTRWIQFRRETRSTARRQLDEHLDAASSEELLLVDGAEQLGVLDWQRLKRRSRRQAGLIITTHVPGRLPTLIDCRTTVPLLASIVEQLVPGDGERLRDELPELFARHAGNIRLCLRELYDRCAAIGGE
jgi:hypothetical protein